MSLATEDVTNIMRDHERLEKGDGACATHVKAPPLETRDGRDHRAFEKVGSKTRKLLIEYPQCP